MYSRCTPGIVTCVIVVCVCEEGGEDQERKSPFRMLLSFLFWGVN